MKLFYSRFIYNAQDPERTQISINIECKTKCSRSTQWNSNHIRMKFESAHISESVNPYVELKKSFHRLPTVLFHFCDIIKNTNL